MSELVCAACVALALIFGLGWLRERRLCERRRAELEEEFAGEKRGLHRAAREREENFRAILASMAEGVVVVDRQRVIRVVNPSLLRLFGLREEPIGKTVLSTLRLPLLETMMRTAMEEQVPRHEETSVQLFPGQPTVHLIVSTLPLGDTAEVPGAVTVIRDISRLRELEELRREFVANVSHELRTPLAIFHGYLENLLDRPAMPQEELLPILKVMDKHSGRLKALVEDLLTLTRLESRRDPLAREEVDLGEFLEAIAAEWQGRCGRKAVRLEVQTEEGLPALSLDPHRFRQVLDNLLDNALKYTPAGHLITVQARAQEETVEVRVTDEGAGIPPTDLPHIFERFYRADKARSRELGGTGLGLSIVKHIVLAHGGTVQAESTFQKGTTITMRFPRPKSR